MSGIKALITLLLILSGILAIQYLIRPMWTEVGSIRQQIAVVNDAIERTKDVIRIYDDLVSRYDGIPPEKIERVTNFLPSKPNVPDLLVDTEVMVADANMKLESIAFTEAQGAVEDGSSIQSLGLTLSVKGNYSSFKQLLASLEKNLRLIDLTNISFSGTEIDDYSFKLQAKTYYQLKSIF